MLTQDEAGERVAAALRNLPEIAPPENGWSRIARRLDRRPAGPRPALALALSAGVLALTALALYPLLVRTPQATQTGDVAATVAASADQPPEPDLATRSADLEHLLAELPPPRAARASTALTASLLEDRIAQVDERLNAEAGEATTSSAAHALLQERVVLLDSLVRVRSAASVGQML